MIGAAVVVALVPVSGWSHDYIWRGEARQISADAGVLWPCRKTLPRRRGN